MKTLPKIGQRVKYYRLGDGESITKRTCSGVVVAHYRGGDKHKDPETGEEWISPDHAGVQVDKPLPDWWPYGGTDRFAPTIEELEPI